MSGRMIAYAVIAAVLAIVAAQWQLRGRQIAHLQQQNAVLAAANATCAADIETQSAAVAALRAAGEAQAARVAQAEQAAAQAGRAAQARVQAALAAKVPTECPAAMRWLGDEGRILANEWSSP